MSYSQNDPAWKNTKIGFDTGASDTIGNYGCYMTAIANVCNWAGHDHNPAQINDLCKQNDWLVSGDLINRNDIPSILCNNLQFVGRTNWNDVVSMNFFDDASDPNVAYIICIDASKAPGIQTHYVMVWSTNHNGDLEIEDSWDGHRKWLSHYGNPGVIIQSATKFIKNSNPVPPPPPPVSEPEPAPAPVVAPTPPAGAAPYPSPNEPYTLVVDVPGYVTSNNAANESNWDGKTKVLAGNYTVFNKRADSNGNIIAINVTSKPGVAGSWINPADNHEPIPEPVTAPADNGWLGPRESGTPDPVPAPVVVPPKVYKPSEVPIGTQDDNTWKSTFRFFYADKRAVTYVTTQDMYMKDYSGKKKPVFLAKGTKLNMYGTFTKNGISFYRARDVMNDANFSWYYAISQVDDDGRANLVKYVEPVVQEIETISEHLHFIKSDVKGVWDIIKRRIKL